MTTPNQVRIPKILQERQGSSLREQASDGLREWYDSAVEHRKNISKKMARTILNITFDKSSVEVADYDDTNPEKYEQDSAFATYEPNLRETYYREKTTRAKELGSMAMVFTGIDLVANIWSDKMDSRSRLKSKRQSYITRNGTIKSHMRDRYVAQMQKKK
jgi:hypothetical protein